MKTSQEELTAIVRTFRPGATVGPMRPLKGGISSGVVMFDVSANGTTETMVLREPGDWALNRIENATQVEFDLLAALKQNGIATSVPYYVAPARAEVPMIIVGFIEGELDLTPADPERYVTEIARAMAAIHRLPLEAFSFMPRMDDEIAHHINWSPQRQKPLADEARIRAVLQDRWPFARQNPAVLQHGDFWPGNLLWDDGVLVAPIDWEDAGIGDPLLDVAVTRQELSFAFNLEMADAFADAYAKETDLDWINLPLWDLYASLRPIDQFSVWASGWADLGRPEITGDTMRAARADLVASALERL